MRRMLPPAPVLLLAVALASPGWAQVAVVPITPFAETFPLTSSSSSYADPAIYLNPNDLSRSLVLAADGTTGLQVYDLQGRAVSQFAGTFKQVDVTYGFPFSGAQIPLVAARTVDDHVMFFTVDPSSGDLTNVTYAPVALTSGAGCLRFARPPDAPGIFELWTTSGAKIERWRVRSDAGVNQVAADHVSTSLDVISQGTVAGCTVDDATGGMYIAETNTGVYRWVLRQDGGVGSAPVVSVGSLLLPASAIALTSVSLVHVNPQEGYLIVGTEQPNGSVFVILDTRFPEQGTSFQIGDSGTVDGVSNSLGAVATNLALDANTPAGLFVVHDGLNLPDHPNFKLVSVQTLAAQLKAADAGTLLLDPSYDPRTLDGGHIVLPDAGQGMDAGSGAGGGGGSGPPIGDVDAPKKSCGCGAGAGAAPSLLAALALLFVTRRARRSREG